MIETPNAITLAQVIIALAPTALWIIALTISEIGNRQKRKEISFLMRWNDCVMECYRAEFDKSIALLGYALRQREQLQKLAPKEAVEELPTSSDKRIADACNRMSQLAAEKP